MDRVRKGKILTFDNGSGKGSIRDENDQEINFKSIKIPFMLEVGSNVTFCITLSDSGLVATDIEIL